MIIAMAISAVVIMGTYSLFNTIFKAQTTTSDTLIFTNIYNNLSKLINDDFINMIELSDEQKQYIDNLTKSEKKEFAFDNNNEQKNYDNNKQADNATDNKTEDNQTAQNYIISDKYQNYPRITFTTYNSIFFNKSLPVVVTYYINDDNYLVRSEKNKDLDFTKEIKLIGNIEDFEISSFNGKEYKENIADPRLMRFLFKINNHVYQISAGKIIKNEKR
jgi:hypothetical protein